MDLFSSQTTPMPVAAAEAQMTLSLLDLPAEIRNHVYKDAVVEAKVVVIHQTKPFICEPALLATNRQVRTEAIGIFYELNTLKSCGAEAFTRFLHDFSQEKQALLRTVHATELNQVSAMREKSVTFSMAMATTELTVELDKSA